MHHTASIPNGQADNNVASPARQPSMNRRRMTMNGQPVDGDVSALNVPVAISPLYADFGTAEKRDYVPVLGKQVIWNTDDKSVISIVSDQYHLLTHGEALKYAYMCCETAFPDVSESEWNLDVSGKPKGASIRVDMTHSSSKLNFDSCRPGDRPDAYGPFIRVRNSYDRSRAFSIEIGFQRKVCSNGLIIPDAILQVRYTHLEEKIVDKVRVELQRDEFRKLQDQFTDLLVPLRRCDVPHRYFLALICCALELKVKKLQNSEWESLQYDLGSLSVHYIDELGETAYAALNAMTDFATRSFGSTFVGRGDPQRRAGAWLADFSERCSDPGFSIDRYVGDLVRSSGFSDLAEFRIHKWN